jgi:CubicO group peptidase (beta-lactamase class C family)
LAEFSGRVKGAGAHTLESRRSRRPPRVLTLTLFVCLGSPPFAGADARFEPLSVAIRRLVEDRQLPSVAVAVASDGRILWQEGFGWADREGRVPASPHTPYSLASISKPFTATAVMKLVEAGRLRLDRPANHYLADARITGRDADRVTVRRLLSHMGGLPTFYHPFIAREPLPMDEIIARYALLASPPGRKYLYSNLGYGILDRIIERVSGVSYEVFLEREVFAPLHLESASVPHVLPLNVALGYDARGRPLPFYTLGHRGASSVYASAHDLVRFGMAHLDDRRDRRAAPILSRRSLRDMQRIHTPESPTQGYGLGWRIHESRSGFRQVGHTGGMPGVSAVLNLYPSERVVVVVLTNTHTAVTVRLARQIAARVMPLHARDLVSAQ